MNTSTDVGDIRETLRQLYGQVDTILIQLFSHLIGGETMNYIFRPLVVFYILNMLLIQIKNNKLSHFLLSFKYFRET